MHKTSLIGAMMAWVLAGAASGQWWWPPTECGASRENPMCGDVITVSVGGLWPDSCVPSEAEVTVEDGTVRFNIYHIQKGCAAAVICPWSVSEEIGTQVPGDYTVTATLISHIHGPYETVDVCTFTVQPRPGDIDGDGMIGFADLVQLLEHWGVCADCPEDIDGDGTVGFTDLLRVLAEWGPCA
jgi:hypothetical protein